MDKSILKKSPEELQEYLHFKKRGATLPRVKKGKGSKYVRKEKHTKDLTLSNWEDEEE